MMAPAEGAVAPDIKSNSVDFPAPFGPMTPQTSPERTANDTSRSATSPPNDFRDILHRKQTRAGVVFIGRVRPDDATFDQIGKQPDKASRRKQRDRDQENADDKNGLTGGKAEKFGDEREQHSAKHDAQSCCRVRRPAP